MRSFISEIKKTKNRFIWLMLPAALTLDGVWMYWILTKAKEVELAEGYYNLLMAFPLVNTIILPLIIAAVASRLCDMENKGNTYKMLCTLQEKESIFRNKLILGGGYLAGFVVLQFVLILLLGWRFKISQKLPWEHIAYYLFATFMTSLILMLLQEILSLMMDNQLYPLFIGLIGTFVGLFSWFFPNLPLRYMIPWGYYCVGCTINNIWYEDTRVVEYFTISFSYAGFAVLIVFGVLLYIYGRNLFLKKEV